jgi:hypothetical protein
MKVFVSYLILLIITISIIVGLSYALGWIGIHQTLTVGKAQQNANREVYEQSQSYVEGKRQEASKLYLEYKKADEAGKGYIKTIVAHSFANFDENLLQGEIRGFVNMCKYN